MCILPVNWQIQSVRMTPDLDGVLREVTRKMILHYRQLYINRPDPIVFFPSVVDTTDQLYDDFSRLLYLHDHHEDSFLTNEIPEESDQFRFMCVVWYTNIRGRWGWFDQNFSHEDFFDLSSRSFIPVSHFIRWRHPLPLLVLSLVFTPRCSV
jgi:hypothetical protein